MTSIIDHIYKIILTSAQKLSLLVLALFLLGFPVKQAQAQNEDTGDGDFVTIVLNREPVANVGAAQSVAEDMTITLAGASATDHEDDNTTLTLAWTQVDATGTVTNGVSLSAADTLNPSFVAPQVSADTNITLRLTVTDSDLATATDDVVITITGDNDAPIANAGTNQGALLNVAVTLRGRGSSDPDGDMLMYFWQHISGGTRTVDMACMPDESECDFIVVTDDGPFSMVALDDVNAAEPVFTTVNVLGVDASAMPVEQLDRVFRLTVTDTGDKSSTDTVTIRVSERNTPPTAMAGNDQSVAEGATLTLTGANATDAQAGNGGSMPFTIAWTQVNATGTVGTLIDADTISPRFVAPQVISDTEITLRLTVTDFGLVSVSDDVVVTITGTNDMPVVEAGPNQPEVKEGVSVTLAGSANDPEGEALTYIWSQTMPTTGKGAGITLSATNVASPTFIAPVELSSPVELVFSLQVDDATGEMGTDTVTITVAVQPPEVLDAAEARARGMAPAAVSDNLITLPTNEPVVLTEAVPTDFSVSVNDDDGTTYLVTGVALAPEPDSGIILTVGIAIPTGMSVTVTYTANMGSIVDRQGNELLAFTAEVSNSSVTEIINRILLPKLARAITNSTVSSIAQRIEQAKSGSTRSASIGGQSLSAAMATRVQALVKDDRDMKKMLNGSDFVLPLDGLGTDGVGSGGLSLWGGVEYRSLDGDSNTLKLDYDGTLLSGKIGMDGYVSEHALLGMGMFWHEGDVDYTTNIGNGNYKLDIFNVNPYVGWSVGQMDLWATAGYGQGDLEVIPPLPTTSTTTTNVVEKSDVEMYNIAVGGSSQLQEQQSGAVLRLKGEAFHTQMDVERVDLTVAKQSVKATQVRVTLEWSNTRRLANGASVQPTVEGGLRFDGGDGETGDGLELGSGIQYTNPTSGLTVHGNARVLVGRENYDEWGVHGSIRLDAGADGQGLSLSVGPRYGDTGSGVQALWKHDLLDADGAETQQDYAMQLDMRLGYGLSGSANGGRLTPYSEMTLGENKHYRAGVVYVLGARYELDLVGEHLQRTDDTENTVLLKGKMSF